MGNDDDNIWSYSNRVDAERAAANAEWDAHYAQQDAQRAEQQRWIDKEREQNEESRNRWEWDNESSGGYTHSAAPLGLTSLIFYAITIVFLSLGVEYTTFLLYQFVFWAFSIIHLTPPVHLLNWIVFTGRIFVGLSSITLMINWLLGRFGRSCLGGIMGTIIKLSFLLVISAVLETFIVILQILS